MNTIDCRNQACPAPVINVKRALEEQNEIRVIVDDGASRENVARFSRNRGYHVTEQQDDTSWVLTISCRPDKSGPTALTSSDGNRILLITSDRLGDGPEELGRLLMKNFIHTLLETSEMPTRMLFLNTGVFLTCEGSDVLEALEKLHGMGMEIYSCGVCLDFFKLKDKLRAGATNNMFAIVESLLTAGQVIKL
ncbi:MAG: sulfurtransferase-like selenium metabolism protein YedF [Verrucomicrobia bacterium]|nr:sulfurtransferase-like selenium metabolism protein YedF [Deltaproteobacteria bacterium]